MHTYFSSNTSYLYAKNDIIGTRCTVSMIRLRTNSAVHGRTHNHSQDDITPENNYSQGWGKHKSGEIFRGAVGTFKLVVILNWKGSCTLLEDIQSATVRCQSDFWDNGSLYSRGQRQTMLTVIVDQPGALACCTGPLRPKFLQCFHVIMTQFNFTFNSKSVRCKPRKYLR